MYGKLVIVWDEPKRLATIRKRGLDFADLDLEFFAGATYLVAKHDRLMAIGEFQERILTVIFRALGSEAISVISMRRSNRKERSIRWASQNFPT